METALPHVTSQPWTLTATLAHLAAAQERRKTPVAPNLKAEEPLEGQQVEEPLEGQRVEERQEIPLETPPVPPVLMLSMELVM